MKYLLMVFILSVFGSCLPKEIKTKQVVKIDVEDSYNSNLPNLLIKSVISLEKNKRSLFGDIGTIEYAYNRFYLLDAFSSKSIITFSDKGDFINKTKLGKGPDEMINPFAFFVDKKKKSVLVYDQTLSAIFTYDLNLNFLNQNKYKGIPMLEFAKTNKNEFLIRSHYKRDYAHTLYLSNFDSIKKQYIADMDYSGAQGLSRSISVDSRTLLISSFDYNIYQLIDGNLHSEYYFDFGKKNITPEDVKRKGLQGIWELISLGQRVSAPHEIAESDNFLLFHVFYKREPIYYIYSIKKQKIYCLNDYFEKGKLPKCDVRGVIKDDIFYAMVEPLDMIEFQESTNQKLFDADIQIQLNPFIITFDISEF